MILFSTLYFFMPSYIANSIPPLLHRFKLFSYLAVPVDFKKEFLGKRIFGDHKTIRGVLGIFFIGFILCFLFFEINSDFKVYEYVGHNSLLFCTLYSLGIIFGDLLFALIKRRLNLKPGAAFIPFDQTNYVIGVFILTQWLVQLDLYMWGIIWMQTFVLHTVFNRFGYYLGLHNAKW